jgi:hypothetical protein
MHASKQLSFGTGELGLMRLQANLDSGNSNFQPRKPGKSIQVINAVLDEVSSATSGCVEPLAESDRWLVPFV